MNNVGNSLSVSSGSRSKKSAWYIEHLNLILPAYALLEKSRETFQEILTAPNLVMYLSQFVGNTEKIVSSTFFLLLFHGPYRLAMKAPVVVRLSNIR